MNRPPPLVIGPLGDHLVGIGRFLSGMAESVNTLTNDELLQPLQDDEALKHHLPTLQAGTAKQLFDAIKTAMAVAEQNLFAPVRTLKDNAVNAFTDSLVSHFSFMDGVPFLPIVVHEKPETWDQIKAIAAHTRDANCFEAAKGLCVLANASQEVPTPGFQQAFLQPPIQDSDVGCRHL